MERFIQKRVQGRKESYLQGGSMSNKISSIKCETGYKKLYPNENAMEWVIIKGERPVESVPDPAWRKTFHEKKI